MKFKGIRRYQGSDYGVVCSWFHKRKMNYPSQKDIPAGGFIVEDVAVGFLVETDTNCCVFDFFITNPEAPKDVSDEALDAIVNTLTSYARAGNYKRIKCTTRIPAIEKRALKHGFKDMSTYKSFIKEI